MTETLSQSPDLAARKAELRREALARRAALSSGMREAAGEAVAGHALALARKMLPERVSAFVSVKGEIPTGPLMERLAEEGVPLCLPVIVRKGAPLVFRGWRPGAPLEDRPFGLREPPESEPEVEPDFLLVPLAAFDAVGGRVGYGGGFYDRTLDRMRAEGRRVVAVGLAFAAQEVDSVPVAPHDAPLDGVLTEDGYRSLGGAAR